jgi:RHS repeat-associated protein
VKSVPFQISRFRENGLPASELAHKTDLLGHTEADLPRTVNGTVITQKRKWVDDPTTQRLTSKTSPEAATVTYTYNTDGTVATVTDAKSQQKKFTYDSYGRVTKIKAPGQSISYSYGSSYDGTNTLGRVATINYSVGSHTVQEGYKYTPTGDVAAKGVALDGLVPLNQGALIATYLYDGEGHVSSVAYPVANTTTWGAPAATYNYGLDSMGRLNTLTDQNNNTLVSGVTYSPANQILSLATSTFTETSTYNANLQLATLVSGSYSYQYNYAAGQNNGRLYSIQDNSSGETIKYLYDSLNRLIQASGSGDTHGSWSQQFTYDGFGNLTQKIGTNAPNNLTINVDPTTNRLTGNGAVYDANGNLTQYTNTLSNITFTYDSLNRLATATGWNGGSGNTANYGYDASNQRVYSNITVGGVTTETFFFYGADRKKLGVWTIPPLSGSFTLVSLNTWFGGRLLKPQDRLNSIGKYFPYGEDRYSPSPANPPNGQEKFATYTRDAETGLDYAYQRYYTAGLGRFMTPDPKDSSASSYSPQSWNRYPYANGDPANAGDPTGEDAICGPNGGWFGEGCYTTSIGYSYNPYTVYSNGVQVNTGSSLGQTSAELQSAENRYLSIISSLPDPEFPNGSDPGGATVITVGCQGDTSLDNFVCAPAAGSWKYFAAGSQAYYSGALAQVFWSNQTLWSTTAKIGNGLGVATAVLVAGPTLAAGELPTLLGPSAGRILWSGPGNAIVAAQNAAVTYGTVLGDTVVGRGISFLGALGVPTYSLWERASQAFAAGATGPVLAFTQGASATSIFIRIEFPMLTSNGTALVHP